MARARGRSRPSDVDRVRARDDGRDQRAARAPRRAHGARHDRGLPRRDRDRPPGPPVALRPRRSGRPQPLVPRELRFTRARADGARRRARAARRGRAGRRPSTRCARPRSRRSRSACCSRSCTPSTSSAVGEAVREALPGRARLALQRGAARVPRVRALLDHGRRRLPRARGSPPTCERLAERRRARPGVPAPLVMQSSGGVVDVGGRGRQRRRLRALRARPAAWSAPRYVGARERLRGRADLRHGRHEHRRRAGASAARRRRRRSRSSPACRSSCRWSTCTRSAPAAARSRGPTRAARCASGPRSAGADPGPAAYGKGGEEPTVTDANLLLGYLADGAELGGEVVLDRELAEAGARARSASELGLDALETALGVVRVANAEMVPRAARHLRRARPRPARVRARRLRRRRRRCTPARWPRSSAMRDRARAARRRRAERARAGDLATSGATTSRPLLGGARRRSTATPSRRVRERSRRREDARRTPTLRRRGRPALPRPVVRADRRRPTTSDALAERFHAAHERRYGYAMDERAGRARQRCA